MTGGELLWWMLRDILICSATLTVVSVIGHAIYYYVCDRRRAGAEWPRDAAGSIIRLPGEPWPHRTEPSPPESPAQRQLREWQERLDERSNDA